jgi:hypothetical protein
MLQQPYNSIAYVNHLLVHSDTSQYVAIKGYEVMRLQCVFKFFTWCLPMTRQWFYA